MTTQTGKTALITGASSGIGKELATLFAQDGYNLVLVALSDEKLNAVEQDFKSAYSGQQITVIGKDLAAVNAPQEIYDELSGQGIQVDVLVNNAGFGEYGMFATETDLQKELDIIQVNISALVYLTKLFSKDMVQRNSGKILMLGSVASVMPNPMMAVYGATKSFIYSFSEALRNELKDSDVTVTVLMPGATDTDFFNRAGAMNTKAQEEARKTDPARVAKDGYEALMAGKDKVISGMKNKLSVASSYVLPDGAVAANMRKQMQDKNYATDQEEESQMNSLLLGVGVAALAVAGLLLFRSYNNLSTYDKLRYRAKAKRLSWKAQQMANEYTNQAQHAGQSVVDSLKGAYQNGKARVEETLA
ncbi:SDR family NAD(P)-dependent oxidoreductase [Rudanella lutea]|uniref:SDR family NAD(P)-dependent oxidoreductase n=1 Tax=Rudanella lutea TaxID=451374 RepID=UPI00036AFCF6|nr:SDR family oxidoreductase [Rudanella lutea]